MNADQPNRHDLLRAASAQMLCAPAPKPGEAKPPAPAIMSAALPAARAVAIALRDLAADQGAHNAALLDHLTALYGEGEISEMMAAADAAGADIGATLNRRLARDIRAGRFDEDPGGLLRALLAHEIAARLRRSNPCFPETRKFSQPGMDDFI